VVPILTKLFASNDRGIRRGLLENIPTYGPSLQDKVVEEQVGCWAMRLCCRALRSCAAGDSEERGGGGGGRARAAQPAAALAWCAAVPALESAMQEEDAQHGKAQRGQQGQPGRHAQQGQRGQRPQCGFTLPGPQHDAGTQIHNPHSHRNTPIQHTQALPNTLQSHPFNTNLGAPPHSCTHASPPPSYTHTHTDLQPRVLF
jgi:hypothetical protein